MTDTAILRNNAIVRNASVGASPPHGPVKTGELPLVQVKAPPGGPQVQEGQQKSVTILPPKDAESAVKTGGLPMVKVKMTDGKPKPDNGVDEKVVIRDSRHAGVSAGALPMVQVKMTQTGPQLENAPQQQSAPPQIPAAQPALSAPRAQAVSSPAGHGYVARPATGAGQGYVSRALVPATGQPRSVRIAAPQVALPSVPELSMDQLMFLRHVADKYLGDLAAMSEGVAEDVAEDAAEGAAEPAAKSDAVKFAEATIETLDDMLVAVAVRAEAAAKAASAPALAPAPTVAAAAATSIAPTPSVSYAAGRVTGRSYVAGARHQRNAGMAPRRTARGPLPPVIVKMDGQRAVVQNQAEVAQARAAALEPQPAVEAQPTSESAETPQQG